MLPCLHSLGTARGPLVSEQRVSTAHQEGTAVSNPGTDRAPDILRRGFTGHMHLRNNRDTSNNYDGDTPDPLCKAAASSHLTLTTTTKPPETNPPTFHSDFASLKWIYKVLPKLPWVFAQFLVRKVFCTAQ